MIVKFNKKQIKALSTIRSRAESFFNEFQQKNPSMYRDSERKHTVDMFSLGILENIINSGEFFLED